MDLLRYCSKTTWDVAVEPILTNSGLYETTDRSYGRKDVPFSPMERRLHENKEVKVSFGKVMLENGKDWVWYQIWQDVNIARKGDIIFVHGTGVHSGTLASHSRRYLKAGFRCIVPDLVSHGYSSGLHVYQEDLSIYTQGLHSVLLDVARRDEQEDGIKKNKWDRLPTFMLGLSFGGTVALHYALDYPHSYRQDVEGEQEVAIDGIIAVGPILGYAPSSIAVPVAAIQLLRFLNDSLHMGRLELVVPHKKALDKDPNVYKSLIDQDQRSHQGAFRIGHLVAIEDAIIRLHKEAKSIRHAIFMQLGGQDRVACHKRSIGWIRKTSSLDKRMAVYPVCQHVVYRKAKTEEEDLAGRIACIEDNVDWMTLKIHQAKVEMNHVDSTSFFFRPDMWDSTTSVSILDRSDSWASTTSTDSNMTTTSSIFSETDSTTPEMTEESPPMSPLVPASTPLQFHDYDSTQELIHPLLTKAHKSTLPTLARLAPQRCYRSKWNMSEELRPFDVRVEEAGEEDEEVVYTGFSIPSKSQKIRVKL